MINDSRPPSRYLSYLIALATPVIALLAANALPAKPAKTGDQIFRQQCASCHGAKGEGTKSYNKRLAGTRSIGELATFIQKSMPPGAPKKLPADDAKSVAAYIYGAFYSPLAQARNKPARIELSHLTVRQYRNAVMDLVGSFRPSSKLDDRRGLRGEYFKLGRFRGNERIADRIDPQIKFDYGTTGALPEQTDPYQFCMRWEGSVIAPDTGDYEFIVRTENGTRLFVNDLKRPLIDVYVKSGGDNEYHANLYLLGGRAYPIKLEFVKGVNGVDDISKVKKNPPSKASMALEWRPPKRIPEVIPQRCLCPVVMPESYVAATPFPPDDKSTGYERASSVSKAWDDATTQGAIEAAGYVAAHVDELAGKVVPSKQPASTSGNPADLNNGDSGPQSPAAERAARLREFCKQFTARAFRRPLTPELEQRYVAKPFKNAPDTDTAVKRCLIMALLSPRFLYREAGASDAYDTASRLSFTMWDSLPDEELLKAAETGALNSREQIAKQAERMAADPRTWPKLREFLLQWLKVDQYPDLAKDPKRYPDFDPAAAADLRSSLEIFLEQTVWSDKSDFRELLLTDKVILNGRLAKLYGANLPADAPFQPVSLDSKERAGVLTHPYLLASFAYIDNSSPIHRGVLIARSILGRTLLPPPQAQTPIPAALHPGMTTRQRVALQTKPPACMGCHSMINPLGFTLEKFDAIGRLRTEDNGSPVDDTGSYLSRNGKTVRFAGVRDLAKFVAESEEARGAFVEKLFQYAVKQPIQAYGRETLPALEKAFTTNQCSIRKQVVETAVVAAMNGSLTKRIPVAGDHRSSMVK